MHKHSFSYVFIQSIIAEKVNIKNYKWEIKNAKVSQNDFWYENNTGFVAANIANRQEFGEDVIFNDFSFPNSKTFCSIHKCLV